MWLRVSISTRVALAIGAALAVASAAPALQERIQQGFPLTFDQTKIDLGEQLQRGADLQVFFTVTNPTDAPVTYFLKSSSRRVHVDYKEIELAPGESTKIEIEVENPVAGPFRHRIGVIVEPMRAALFIEGTVLE